MKIGILGGTFNPIHIGHLILAQECRNCFDLDKVIFVPTAQSPLKDEVENVSPEDRLKMVELAIDSNEQFEVSDYEIKKGGISYSIDTIRHFKETHKDSEIFFISGADSAVDLSKWKDVDGILELCTFVIATRPGWEEKSEYEDKILRIVIPYIDVSSTFVRERIKIKDPVRYFVSDKVLDYIKKQKFYI